ncbi:MAG TPA: glycosyltransferase [Candidatus Acidoferrales bacterium]|nr:glycosyltransferase [Candidatus Acidoferrales bacterium]
MVTPYPPKFGGIATYADELIHAIKGYGHTVYIICNPDVNDGGHLGQEDVFPAMDVEKEGWYNDVFKAIKDVDPDVVHIQHEYGLYDINDKFSTDLLDLLVLLNLDRIPTAITYHSVYSTLSNKEHVFMNLSLQLVDAGIVHEELQKIFLPVNLGWVPQNLHVIPHGAKMVEEVDVPDKAEAKRLYGLFGKNVVMCLGWWEPYKKFEDVVKIWPEVVKEDPNAILVIAGDARPGSRRGVIYKPALLTAIDESPAKESILVIQGSFSPKEYNTILNVADIIVLPYDRSSQSGVLAHAFALGKAAIVTDVGGLMAEVRASGAGVVAALGDLDALRDYILLLLKNAQIRAKYAQKAVQYVEKRIGWKYVAGMHLSLYSSIFRSKKGEESSPNY